MIAALLASRLFGPIAALAAAVLLATSVSECAGKAAISRKLDQSEAARVAAAGDLAQCKLALSSLGAAASEQNAAVAAYKADGERRLAAARAAVKAAENTGAKASAATVLAGRGHGDLCRSAETVLRGGEG